MGAVHNHQAIVGIVDANEFRRVALIKLLEPWCAAERLKIIQVSLEPTNAICRAENTGYKLLILNIGGDGLRDNAHIKEIDMMRVMAPDAPTVVVADREHPDDAHLALLAGAQGFIVTSGIKSSLALQAFSFIINGGAYFPLAALRAMKIDVDKGSDAPDDNCRNGDGELNDSPHNCLTLKQKEVLKLIGLAKCNKAIARELGMTEGTVKVHVRNIMHKLGAVNRTELAIAYNSKTANAGAADVSASNASPVAAGIDR